MGTLTKNTHRHDSRSRRIAPAEGPRAAPRAAEAPHTPITMDRRSGGKSGRIIDSEAGLRIEAPIPWTTRAAINHPTAGAMPEPRDPTIKTTTPTMNVRRRPFRSARRPAMSRNAPMATE